MRPSLLPNLVAAAARNLARKQEQGALFEVGPRFTGAMPGEQVVALAGVALRRGRSRGTGPRRPRPVDAIDAKADALAALAAAGRQARERAGRGRRARPGTIPGRSGSLRQGGRSSPASASCIPRILRPFDLARAGGRLRARPRRRAAAEGTRRQGAAGAGAAALPAGRPRLRLRRRRRRCRPARLLDAIRGVDRKLIREVRLFDVYDGPGVGRGQEVAGRRGAAAGAPTAR